MWDPYSEDDSGSVSSDDDTPYTVKPKFVTGVIGTGTLGTPHERRQGAFLCNLVKLLNGAGDMNLCPVMRWSRRITNALEINWDLFLDNFEEVHRVLVLYKIARRHNRAACGRASLNRKLREWDFDMVTTGGTWTAYVYKNGLFCQSTAESLLPSRRR